MDEVARESALIDDPDAAPGRRPVDRVHVLHGG